MQFYIWVDNHKIKITTIQIKYILVCELNNWLTNKRLFAFIIKDALTTR
jgi:hypothetical protein